MVVLEIEKNTLENYNLHKYINDVEEYGLKDTWNKICDYILLNGESEFLNTKNFGKMYEVGLATVNKEQKKTRGQYYTPDDVAAIMSEWLRGLEGDNICDIACGTGQLILTYLDLIERNEAEKILSEGRLYLYDTDKVALKVCRTAICVKFGIKYLNKINIVHCDFLDKTITLPKNSKVISNPPYAAIKTVNENWEKSDVIDTTKEFYAAFMEKILLQSKSAVIISPFSFISGRRFYPLRKIMNNKSGEIYSFDNVPGNIFRGKKHGIFNTNLANSVRAAITVIKSNEKETGFRLTPLIRFKSAERKDLLKCSVLEKMLSAKVQKVSQDNKKYFKCHPKLLNIFEEWIKSDKTIKDYIAKDGKYELYLPDTCRYYTTASDKKLSRNGQIKLTFNDKDVFNFMYCFINSSFAYWYWRLYDGAILYPKSLLLKVPVFFDKLTEKDKQFFKKTSEEMIKSAKNFKTTKNNVGLQENIRYPKEYRDKINQYLLNLLGINSDCSVFDVIHSNTAL